MKRLSVLVLAFPSLLVAHSPVAPAQARGTVLQQREEGPLSTPLEDPYDPPTGDPDILVPDDISGEGTSSLNPAED
jgi:hypothetical protein